MTDEQIIEMAKECGLVGMRPHLDGIYFEALEAFAKLVAQYEREACAKVCENVVSNEGYVQSKWCVDAIRARGEA